MVRFWAWVLNSKDSRDLASLKNLHIKVEDDKLSVSVDKISKKDQKSTSIELEEKGGTLYESAYAHVYKKNYKLNSEDENTFISELIAKIKQHSMAFREDQLTFENGITHISSEFQATVDYIMYLYNISCSK